MSYIKSLTASTSWKDFEKENQGVIDSELEFRDPTPNIHELFVLFDKNYFWGELGMVEVKWSNRMTTCAGLCYYQGKRGLCSIKLSAPLLSLRPRKDLVETLLHEMIHAYLFVTQNFRDREDHGPEFHKHMNRINKQAGTNITVYHTFHDEVDYYKRHIWRCNGPCKDRRPYFGFVKRAMNRAPGPNDFWWKEHQSSCGGTFIKISEPTKTDSKKSAAVNDKKGADMRDIREFLLSENSKKVLSSSNEQNSPKGINCFNDSDLNKETSYKNKEKINNGKQASFILPQSPKTGTPETSKYGKTVISGSECQTSNSVNLNVNEFVRGKWADKYSSPGEAKRSNSSVENSPVQLVVPCKRREVTCPVCCKSYSETVINEHIDECLLKEKSRDTEVERKPLDQPTNGENGPNAMPYEVGNEESEPDFEGIDDQSKYVRCCVCYELLEKVQLSEHLDICLEFTFGTDDTNEKAEGNRILCPCCSKLIPESTINSHIDECLTFIALKSSN